jgi:nitrogenase molybdenum-iron protein beta chain
MQQVDNIVNGQKLFLKEEYQVSLKAKQEFEGSAGSVNPAKVEEVADWTKSWDYSKSLSTTWCDYGRSWF